MPTCAPTTVDRAITTIDRTTGVTPTLSTTDHIGATRVTRSGPDITTISIPPMVGGIGTTVCRGIGITTTNYHTKPFVTRCVAYASRPFAEARAQSTRRASNRSQFKLEKILC